MRLDNRCVALGESLLIVYLKLLSRWNTLTDLERNFVGRHYSIISRMPRSLVNGSTTPTPGVSRTTLPFGCSFATIGTRRCFGLCYSELARQRVWQRRSSALRKRCAGIHYLQVLPLHGAWQQGLGSGHVQRLRMPLKSIIGPEGQTMDQRSISRRSSRPVPS